MTRFDFVNFTELSSIDEPGNFRVQTFEINAIANLLIFVYQLIDELRDAVGILNQSFFLGFRS